MQFHRPETVENALSLLADGTVSLLAGGTDFFPARMGRTAQEPVLDLTRIAALKGISKTGDRWRIGATTTWSQIRDADLPARFRALQQAAAEVGSVQIQNAGTIAGNICNASPAADGVPPLLTLNATVEIAGPGGIRTVPLPDFITGVRKTALLPGEIVTAVLMDDEPGEVSAFLKLGARRYLVISIAMVAVNVALAADGTIGRIAIAVGSCSAVARRIASLEQVLSGVVPGSEAFAEILARVDLPELSPIDDVRATAIYRMDAAKTLIGRAVMLAAEGRA